MDNTLLKGIWKYLRSAPAWLRISYWVGAVVDALAAGIILDQAIFAHISPLTHYAPQAPYRYAMGLGGSLMFGWSILLLWADRRPLDRKAILPITNLVIIGLIASDAYAVQSGFARLSAMAPLLISQVMLIALFTASYLASIGNTKPMP